MTLKDWFETRKEEQIAARPVDPKIDDYVGKLWVKCFNCNAQLPRKELEHHMMVCPECGYHFRINARTRISQLFDEGTFEEYFTNISPADPLEFTDTEPYTQRQQTAKAKTNLNDAVITGIGKIEGEQVACAVMDFEYMGGSMGSVVGEKVTRIIEEALNTYLLKESEKLDYFFEFKSSEMLKLSQAQMIEYLTNATNNSLMTIAEARRELNLEHLEGTDMLVLSNLGVLQNGKGH